MLMRPLSPRALAVREAMYLAIRSEELMARIDTMKRAAFLTMTCGDPACVACPPLLHQLEQLERGMLIRATRHYTS